MHRIIMLALVLGLMTTSAIAQPSAIECTQAKEDGDKVAAIIKSKMVRPHDAMPTMTPQERAQLKSRIEANLVILKQCFKIEVDKLFEDLKRRGYLREWEE